MVDWTRDELVLVAEAVRRNGWRGLRASSEIARELSDLLSTGALQPGVDLADDFRSRNSIQRKSYDLLTSSADYTGKPTRGGKLTAEVMAAFRSDPGGMEERAAAVRTLLAAGERVAPFHMREPDDGASAVEGGILETVARRRERSRALRHLKIDAVLAAGLPIACEVCRFDFGATYGPLGEGYIEVHHVDPLHITGPRRTVLSDLALLCANCHRMCHRRDWSTPADVASVVAQQRRDLSIDGN